MTLILPQSLRGQIETEAQRAFPRECCGLIEGRWHGANAEASALHAAPDGAADRFTIEPAFHFAALREARARGRSLIGCYHSHPGGRAHPSETDRQGAGAENFFWLIAALDSAGTMPVLQAWRYSGSAFEETGLATGADLVASSSNAR